MNDIDQFDAMDEMSDWVVANAKLLADVDRAAQTQRLLVSSKLQPRKTVDANLDGSDRRRLDSQNQ